MKIEMTADLIGAESRLLVGDIVEMEKGRAVSFIQGGYAKAIAGPEPIIDERPTQNSVEAELTALGVYFLRGADLGSLIALLGRSKAAAKPDPLEHDRDGRKGGSRKSVAAPPAQHQEGL